MTGFIGDRLGYKLLLIVNIILMGVSQTTFDLTPRYSEEVQVRREGEGEMTIDTSGSIFLESFLVFIHLFRLNFSQEFPVAWLDIFRFSFSQGSPRFTCSGLILLKRGLT